MYKEYSKDWFMDEENLCAFEKAYFDGGKSIGISVIRTDPEIEKKAECYEKNGEVNVWVAAWKMGRLTAKGEPKIDGKTINNGYGKGICYEALKKYLDDLNDKAEVINQCVEKEQYAKAYRELMPENSPTNFGTVYILTMLHFITKGKIPIYDQFAHKAVKALCAEVSPEEIYVGSPPDKNDVTAVVNLLREYMWLLEKVFGHSDICRKLDRALWVYGHKRTAKTTRSVQNSK